MNPIQNEINQAVEKFTASIVALAKKQATENLSLALGELKDSTPRNGNGNGHKAKAKAKGRTVGGRRSPDDLAALTESLLKEITANPGQGIEAITKNLGVRSAETVLPIKKLLKDKQIKKTGEKRSTKYFAAGASIKEFKAEAKKAKA
jgi:hypothetical protein